MLLDAASDPDRLNEVGLRWWSNERFAIGWKGHLFLPGYAGGAPSVAELAAMLTTSSLADIAQEICGVFGMFVHDRTEGGWTICVDNSGLYKIFYDAHSASTSFLELVRARRIGRNDLADEALIEFIAYGAVFSGRTFVTTIAELRGGEVLQIPADGSQTRTERKTLSTQDVVPADAAVVNYCRDLARSLDGRMLSVDATGGFDSRLVLCLLGNQGLPFELAISGLPGTGDTEIARRIATMLDRPFHLAGHDLDNFDQVLSATFQDGDGQTDVRRLHRDRQAALARLGRGVEVMAHGGGGEFFRDHYVIQDFPFYGSSRVNFKRYHDLRMMPVQLPLDVLSARARDLFASLRPAMLSRFEELLTSTNNESYDRIYLYIRGPEFYGQYFSNYINKGLDVVAPLLDYRNINAAIALSPWRRFFFLWHRKMITAHCPNLAALPTADGFTASSDLRHMIGDAGAFAMTQVRRAARKASQRLFGKSKFYTVGAFMADAPGFMGKLRDSQHLKVALARLKATGLFNAEASSGSLRDVHVGRVITVGMFLGEIEGHG